MLGENSAVPEGSMLIICKYNHHGNIHHSIHKGIKFLSMTQTGNLFWWKIFVSNPEQKVKDLVKPGKRISLSIVELVLYQHGLKSLSGRRSLYI